MAIIKAISSHAPINTVLDYVSKKEKVESRLISGIGCTPETAKEEMQSTKELYGKTGGRTYKHFVQSFAPEEDITPKIAHDIAVRLVNNTELFKGYEVLVATHEDKNHIHSHFIVNSVSYEDGRKFQMSSKDLQNLKDKSDELCRESGLSVCERGKSFDGSKRQGVVSWVKEKYQYLKSAFDEETKKSYICNMKEAIQNTVEKACSIDEYKRLLAEQGISVNWKNTRKHITYIDLDGKKVRDSNLKKTFNLDADKESLLQKFSENRERLVENSLYNSQKNIIISEYKATFYEKVQSELKRQIQGQRQVFENVSRKIKQAEDSIIKIQADVGKWTKQKEECSNLQMKMRYELQEKIEHGKVLIESIQEDKENYMLQYGFSSIEDVEKVLEDIQQAETLQEKLEEKEQVERDNLNNALDEYIGKNSLDEKMIVDAREELKQTFSEDFSEEIFSKAVDSLKSYGQYEAEEAISLDEERSRS